LIEFPLFTSPLKGELTVVISKKNNKNHHNIDKKEIISRIKKEALIYLKKYSLKDVVELIVVREKIQKKLVYEICLDLKKNEKKIN
jgi:16S rRNA C1402 (ribose-2'-O) methylase RsmI